MIKIIFRVYNTILIITKQFEQQIIALTAPPLGYNTLANRLKKGIPWI